MRTTLPRGRSKLRKACRPESLLALTVRNRFPKLRASPRRRRQEAKAVDCKSTTVGSTPTGASEER